MNRMLTEIIARFITDTPDAALPAGALAAARDALVDTVACGLAGTDDDASRIAAAWVAAKAVAARAASGDRRSRLRPPMPPSPTRSARTFWITTIPRSICAAIPAP